METILLLSTLLLTVSCGRKRITTVVQNPYDDSKLKTELVLQDARIKALEDRLDALESGFDQLEVDFTDLHSTLTAEYTAELDNKTDTINAALDILQAKVASLETEASNNTKVVKVCNSSEYLLRIGSSYYAIYMVSNNYGTYLGKLSEGVSYRTTDSTNSNFRVETNKTITCL